MSDDFLRTQLRQAEDALATAERLRRAAEDEYRAALEQLAGIARSLLPAEWNGLRCENPDAASWPPGRLAGWIVETGRRKLNRLELMSGGEPGAEADRLARERDELAAQLREARDSLATREAGCRSAQEQVAARDAELARLRDEVVALRERETEQVEREGAPPPPAEPAGVDDADWLVYWQGSAGYERGKAALHAVGSRGHSLRLDVARAVGMKDASSGWARRVFDDLGTWGLIEEERPRVESVGQTPYLLRLTERGREAFAQLFGEEPVASEYDRLLARHKSAEHVLLNLQARDALLAAGAETVDLYPRPVVLPGGGTFDVDLVAVVDGRPLYVEAERAAGGKVRAHKWANYSAVTDAFYVVVPNKRAKGDLLEEISRWAYDDPAAAEGVTLHVCQLSAFDGETLWQTVRPLGRRNR